VLGIWLAAVAAAAAPVLFAARLPDPGPSNRSMMFATATASLGMAADSVMTLGAAEAAAPPEAAVEVGFAAVPGTAAGLSTAGADGFEPQGPSDTTLTR